MTIRSTANSFDPVEAQLQDLLRPVQPSQKFVQTMRQRIHFSPRITLANRPPEARRFLIVAGSVLSVSLLLITGVRAVFYLLNRARD